jgi:hypothetical protein
VAFLGKLKKQSQMIQEDVAELVVYSKGSFSWTEVWMMSWDERKTAARVLDEFIKKQQGDSAPEYL